MQASAREIVAGADLIEKPTRYKTLYYGLKLNHVRNVAIVHPLMFTLRRICYALTIVLIPNWPLIGTWILLIGTLVMLGYALVEWQWQQPIINSQHIFNEVITYLVCIYLLMFTHFVKLEQRVILGYTLLGCFVTFLSYNTIIMLIMLCHNLKLWIKRLTTIQRRVKLKQEALSILDKLRGALRSLTQRKKQDGTTSESTKDWFVPEELGHVWLPEIVATSSGGANCIIVERIDPVLRRYVSTIVDVS